VIVNKVKIFEGNFSNPCGFNLTTNFLINERIRARTVRLTEEDRPNSVVIPFHEALTKARNQGLDLVMVAEGDPPVCRILDADRFRFEKKKTERELARRQREMTIEIKEIQLRPVTDDNDLSVKAKRARGFLEEGDKVKVTVRFKGRERTHKDWGRQMVAKFLSEIGEHKIDKPLSEGDYDLTIILASLISKSDLIKRKIES
jgi:translation initiation factor IF-3